MKKMNRRQALAAIGAAGTALAGLRCTENAISSSAAEAATITSTNEACAVTPSETVGPFPSLTDLIRSDIREGKSGTPLALAITVVNVNQNCSPVANAMVDIWQCDADGHYSEYTQAGYDGRSETFLRGIQVTDANGRATFTTVYPGWYAGRATHIHVEVSAGRRSLKVTPIAFPEDVTTAVYGTGVYADRGQNPTSNARDGIFRDSLGAELAAISGDPARGFTATFQIGIAA